VRNEDEHTHTISRTSLPRTPLSVPINLGSLPIFHATAQFAAPVPLLSSNKANRGAAHVSRDRLEGLQPSTTSQARDWRFPAANGDL
jgi:hypothetical protein